MKRFVPFPYRVLCTIAFAMSSVLLMFAIVSCEDGGSSNRGGGEDGSCLSSVSFQLSYDDSILGFDDSGSAGARTIAPKPNLMSVSSYSVQGVGPNGASFGPVYSKQSSLSANGLVPGYWTIVATAYNPNGNELLEGSVSCVLSGGSNRVEVPLDSLPGEGVVQVSFKWDASLSSAKSLRITASFEDSQGRLFLETLDVSMSSRSALLQRSLPAGSYVLTVRIDDSQGLSRGCAEAIRIVCGETSIGVVNVGDASSGLEIVLNGHVGTPIPVYAKCKPTGTGFLLSANCDSLPYGVSASSLKFRWYRDGEAVGFAQTLDIPSSGAGHRYDVVVSCNVAGTTGSATVNVN